MVRINKGSTEQAEIYALFESKGWLLVPRTETDSELKALISFYGFKRSQITRQFLVWRKMGGSASVNLPAQPIAEIKQSLEDRPLLLQSLLQLFRSPRLHLLQLLLLQRLLQPQSFV
jgi:hypothetical protein